MATREDSVFDMMTSECMTLHSDVKTGLGIIDFVH
jgi:hypothetical protein